jgi:hypothetical protein
MASSFPLLSGLIWLISLQGGGEEGGGEGPLQGEGEGEVGGGGEAGQEGGRRVRKVAVGVRVDGERRKPAQ